MISVLNCKRPVGWDVFPQVISTKMSALTGLLAILMENVGNGFVRSYVRSNRMLWRLD